jgi:hypothetical protein
MGTYNGVCIMALNYLNPVMSSAAITSGTNSTYHTLSGQAEQILLCSESTDEDFYFTFDSSGNVAAATSGLQYCPGAYSLLINVNHPAYINIVEGTSSGTVHITEFV